MKAAKLILLALWCLGCTACNGGGAALPVGPPAHGSDGNASGALAVSVHLSGLEFRPLAAASASANCMLHVIGVKQAKRRIDPGDIPSSVWIGQPLLLASGQWQLTQLPANQNVVLQVDFAPAVNLATGAATAGDYQATVFIPVFVPDRGTPTLEIDLSFSPNPAGGFFIDSRTRRTDQDQPPMLARLDYAASVVARDSDGDGDFSNEIALPDPAHLGVSAPLLARLDAENEAADTPAESVFHATLEAVDPASGALTVHGLQQLGLPHVAGNAVPAVRFAEDSAFVNRQVSLLEESAASQRPQQMGSGTELTLRGRLLPTGAAGAPELWLARADKLTLNLPPDTIAAVPLKQAARPGEPVPVTVYVNRTASALHAVQKLRVSFDAGNNYLPGSLDPGDRGGGADLPDGVWAASGAEGFNLPDPDKLASGTIDAKRTYVELSLAPTGGSEVQGATGALCNFELVCHDSAALGIEKAGPGGSATFYTGLNGVHVQWANCAAASAPQVQVSGQPIELRLASSPAVGSGTSTAPYIVAPGAEVHFTLTDPLAGDVTANPQAKFTVRRSGVPPAVFSGGSYTLPAGYFGPLTIEASYNGIFAEQELALFVDQPAGFSLSISDQETYIYGGSAQQWSLNTEPGATGEYLNVRVFGQGVRNLHALFFKLNFDPQLYMPIGMEVFEPLRSSTLLPPDNALSFDWGSGRAQVALCTFHPEATPGVAIDGAAVDVHFRRTNTTYPLLRQGWSQFHVPDPNYGPCALASIDADQRGLTWRPFIGGDYNQDGRVSMGTDNASAIGDWTQLCQCFDAAGFAPDSAADVIDRRWDSASQSFRGDGTVGVADLVGIMANLGTVVDAWHVYYAPDLAAYPLGTLAASIPYTSHTGDPLAGRISFNWRPAEGLKPGYYWLTPAWGKTEGAALAPLQLVGP